jgi:hypothetical protein
MNGIDEQLSQRIDEILLIGSLDIEGRSPLLAEALKGLFSDLDECLRHPVEHDIRRAALAVSAATPGPSQGAEATFRTALISLRDAIEDKRAQEVAAEQLANDPELVQEFLVEAREHLSGVETGILILEQEPGNTEALNGVFRSFHTIKGLPGGGRDT